MKENQADLIRYRLGRSHGALEEAFLMQREKHFNTCVNRLYYACFYAVTALLATKGMSSSKHSGVKSLFNRHWVKTHIIDKEYGKLYNHLFENRQEGDYVDFVSFDKDIVEPWIPRVIDFINTITQLIEEASQKGKEKELP